MNIKNIIPPIIILILSFLEIIIYNEEMLLTLCFISFIYFIWIYLDETIVTIYTIQNRKIENDMLAAFGTKYELLSAFINIKKHSRNLTVLFYIFFHSFKTYYEHMDGSRLLKLRSVVYIEMNNKLAQSLNNGLNLGKIYREAFIRAVMYNTYTVIKKTRITPTKRKINKLTTKLKKK